LKRQFCQFADPLSEIRAKKHEAAPFGIVGASSQDAFDFVERERAPFDSAVDLSSLTRTAGLTASNSCRTASPRQIRGTFTPKFAVERKFLGSDVVFIDA
jgi:hypothetical protein